MIIGVTDEETKLVDEFVAKRKPTYPIVILKSNALETALGVAHFPFNGVIDTEGKLVYAGDSPESTLGKVMKNAKPGSPWPKKLVKASLALRASRFGDAWAEIQAVTKDSGLDEREKKVLERFQKYVESNVSDDFAAAKKEANAGLVYRAVKRLEPLSTATPPLPVSEDAGKLLAELRGGPKFDDEMKGGEAFDAADAKEDAQDYLAAFNAFKDVAKKYAEARIGSVANGRAKSILDRGMAGYAPACPKCQEAKKACPKHAKPLKL